MNGLRNQPWYPLLPLVPIHILAYLCNFTNCFFNAAPSFFGVGFSLLYVGFLLAVPFSAKHFLAEILCHFFTGVFRQSLCFLSGDFLWKCGQHRLCPFPAVCACLLRTDRGSLSGNHGSLPASAGRAALPVFSP